MSRARWVVPCAVAQLVLGCGSDAEAPHERIEAVPGTLVRLDYDAASTDFYAAPFPSDARLTAGDRVSLAGFPAPTTSPLLPKIIEVIERDARGFSTTAGVFFTTSAELPSDLAVSVQESVTATSPVFVIAVDRASPDVGRRSPAELRFRSDGGPFGAPNLLSVLPLQGAPLRPHTRYAVGVTRDLRDAAGERLGRSEAMAALLRHEAPAGWSAEQASEHHDALDVLADSGLDARSIAGFTLFTTDDPTRDAGAVLAAARSAVAAPSAPVALEVFDEFCVFESEVAVPDYQAGTPPYASDGGGWTFDGSGDPVLARQATARLFVTIPRRAMPSGGFPLVVFARTGGGGDRPLADRGVRDATGAVLVPGTGPAQQFARAGWAGASLDGPHGGPRNATQGDEQFLMFNVSNPTALRDNVRQSAIELALVPDLVAGLVFDVSACPGAVAPAGARVDTSHLALMGHSMGASIAPLTMALDPRFDAVLLSGSGGSMIQNVIYKQKPVRVRPAAEALLGVAGAYTLHAHDPALSLYQWATEPQDAPVWSRVIVQEPPAGAAPRSVLMMQGIVDHYIMPPIAEAESLALGVDLAGPALDSQTPELQGLPILQDLLGLSGAAHVDLPAAANRGGALAVVTQHAEDGVEDGHEVVFQTERPKLEYRCLLESLVRGAPQIPAAGAQTCD